MSKQGSPRPSGLDEEAITRLEAGLPQGSLNTLLRLFADELGRRSTVVDRLLANGDLAELGAVAHSLQGSAATYGAPGLASAAAELGKQVASGNPAGVTGAAHQLVAEVTSVRDELERRLGSSMGDKP